MPTIMSTPRTLKNFNIFLDGRTYLGKCSKITLPEFKVKLENMHPGGYDSELECDMGVEVMKTTFSLYDYDSTVLSLFGLQTPNSVRLIARGALQRDNEQAVPMIVTMQGSLTSVKLGDWAAGKLSEADYEMSLRYCKVEIDNTIAIEIDVANAIRNVNGVDQLTGMRNALGVS